MEPPTATTFSLRTISSTSPGRTLPASVVVDHSMRTRCPSRLASNEASVTGVTTGPLIEKKVRLGIDSWGSTDQELPEVVEPVHELIAREFAD